MTLRCVMILGDYLEIVPQLARGSVQMVFADLPYATKARKHTSLAWDIPVNVEETWQCLRAVSDSDCTYVFTANTPLSSALYASNPSAFRHDLVYEKQIRTGFLSAERAPLKAHENILVFSQGKHTYNSQMTPKLRQRKDKYGNTVSQCYALQHKGLRSPKALSYPPSIISPKWEETRFKGAKRSLHPTQKPVALMDWLIKTYSNEGGHVLDPVCGSGTTAVSAIQNGRSVTCIEKDAGYFDASVERAEKAIKNGNIDARLEVRRI